MKTQWDKIVETFKANRNKPSYWVQMVGSLLVVGILIAHYFFGVGINSDMVLVVPVIVGSLLAVWGSATDNSILESAGNTLKGNSNQIVNTADNVSKVIDTAVDQLNEIKKNTEQVKTQTDSAELKQ